MPIPLAVTRFNKKIANPVLRHLVGIGPVAELEHVGRRTGLARHAVIFAFRQEGVVTVALTYGPNVDWLKNIEAAGGARLRIGGQVLTLGPVTRLTAAQVSARMPLLVRTALSLIRVEDFVEMPVLSQAAPGGPAQRVV